MKRALAAIAVQGDAMKKIAAPRKAWALERCFPMPGRMSYQ